MRNRTNQILLAIFLITAAFYTLFLLSWLEIIPRLFYDPDDPFRFYDLRVFLGMWFHAVPCFFLQLLVCRTAKRIILRLIPLFLLIGIVALFIIGFSASVGWDALGWVILLGLCIAPAIGYSLAWGTYGISYAYKRRHKEANSKRN